MSRILDIRGLEAEYYTASGAHKALRGVDLYLEKGECAGVVGESGCGKSTLAAAVLDIIDNAEGGISSGSIFFSGEDIASLPPSKKRKLRGNRISLILQDPYGYLNPVIRIGSQLKEACAVHGKSPSEADALCRGILEEVNLSSDVMGLFPHQLSGGMLQRVAIAASLLNSPDVLIADEPTSSLDVTIQKKIISMLSSLKQRHSLSMIFITHNLNLIASFADRIYILYAGEVLEYGTAGDIFRNPSHPYTRGLINALPDIKQPGRRIKPIPGSVPDISAPPEGCSFLPRCVCRTGDCSKPQLMRRVSEGHFSRCGYLN